MTEEVSVSGSDGEEMFEMFLKDFSQLLGLLYDDKRTISRSFIANIHTVYTAYM